MILKGGSIGKLCGDFSVKPCVSFIDVRSLDNGDSQEAG